MKKKTIKAWVVLNPYGEVTTTIENNAKGFKAHRLKTYVEEHQLRNKDFSILPCTITYTLPTKKKNP